MLVESVNFETNKTKEMVSLLNKLELTNAKVLLVVEELTDNVCLASRNLGNVKVVLPEEVNTYDVVNSDKMIVTEAALKKLEEVLGNE
jgi:large subunit ribosomal protein L4